MFNVVLCVVASAKPSDFKWLGVIVVVSHRVALAADFAGLSLQPATALRFIDKKRSAAAGSAEASCASFGLFGFMSAKTDASTEPTAPGWRLELASAALADACDHFKAPSNLMRRSLAPLKVNRKRYFSQANDCP